MKYAKQINNQPSYAPNPIRHNGLWYGNPYGYIKLTKDGNTLVEVVPCYRKSDGKIGMYDLVSGQFLVNAGDGAFLKGADV